jgi:hypothetical protein
MFEHGVELAVVPKLAGGRPSRLHEDHHGESLILRLRNRYFLLNPVVGESKVTRIEVCNKLP